MQATLFLLGDFLHVDDNTIETPAHRHKLDADGRFHKIALSAADVGEEMAMILAQHHRQLKIVVLSGNHDDNSYHVPLVHLRAVFHNNPRVVAHDKPGAH